MSLSPVVRSCLVALCVLVAAPAQAIIVNTDSDADDDMDGVCSLREAIIAVNNAADYNECHAVDGGGNYVAFTIPPNVGETHEIALTSPLPTITKYIGLDGSLQSGSSCVAQQRVQITNPNDLGTDGLVFDVGSDYSTVGSIAISGFSGGAGIRIDSQFVSLGCMSIGTDAAGTVAQPNAYGVRVAGSYARIGLITSVDRLPNLISGNSEANIWIESGVEGTLIAGNRIGVDASGLAALQSGYGIYDLGTNTQVGSGFTDGDPVLQRNVIAVKDNGVNVSVDIYADHSDGLVVAGNYIGVGSDGHTTPDMLGNLVYLNGTTNALIGCYGDSSWDRCRNVIANAHQGSSIGNDGSATAIVSNFIGVAADGSTLLPSFGPQAEGISTYQDALIARNLISTGSYGIDLLNFAGDSPVFLNAAPAGSGGAILDSSDNCVTGNDLGGVVVSTVDTATPTTFAGNWWGAADGPKPAGSGDSAAANVEATPFLTSPPPFCGFDSVFRDGFD